MEWSFINNRAVLLLAVYELLTALWWQFSKPQPLGCTTLQFINCSSIANTSKAPAGRTPHTRCAPRSRCSLRCLRRLRRPPGCPFESHPRTATAPHASPASSMVLRFAPDHRLPRACGSRPVGRSLARATAPSFTIFKNPRTPTDGFLSHRKATTHIGTSEGHS
mgnify:CR=1 FL=1